MILGAVLASLSAPAAAQDEPGEPRAAFPVAIEGRVFDADGLPTVGAVVMSSAGGSAVSTSDGTLRLEVADCPWGVSVEVTASEPVSGRTATSCVQFTPAAPTWSVGALFI
jgi:hypothetical protein